MAAWEHGGGFSVDTSVRIEAADRAGLERLLRYCARPAFALERLREIDPEHLVYESAKPGPGGSVSLILTPMELLDRLAALIPPRVGNISDTATATSACWRQIRRYGRRSPRWCGRTAPRPCRRLLLPLRLPHRHSPLGRQ